MRTLPAYPGPMRLLRPLASSPGSDSPPRVHPEVEAWAIRAAASIGFGGRIVAMRSEGAGIDTTPIAASVDLSDPLASAVVRARRYARRATALIRMYRRGSRQRAALRQLQSFDAAALPDLGLTRPATGPTHVQTAG